MKTSKTISAILLLFFFSTAIAGKSRTVEVLLSSDTDIYARGLNGIQSVIQAELRINYLDMLAENDRAVAAYFRKLENAGTPLVITIGPRAARVALQHLQKTPVLFSMVSSPRTLGVSLQKSCGVSMDVSIAEYFRTLKGILPHARNVYAFYSTEQGAFIAGEGDYFDLRFGLFYHRKKIRNREDLLSELRRIRKKADAIFMVPDPLYDRVRFRQLSKFCRRNKLILMTGFASLVKAGATFAVTSDYMKIGVLTGEMANRILTGRSSCAEEGVRFPYKTSFYLNEKYARDSGIVIPAAIRKRARMTRLFNAGIKLFNRGKLKSAKIVFEAILKKRSENRIAATYREKIIGKLTGEKTRKLLDSAEKYFIQGKYGLAIRDYEEALRINPNLEVAKKGQSKARLAKSESERSIGRSLASKGDYFQALRMYVRSLQTLNTNSRARSELEVLRRTLYPRIPRFLDDGRIHYNKREYNQAISLFANILLINPGNKQAIEYLRISQKKKMAIERLLRRRNTR